MGERASEDRQLPLTKYLGVAALSAVVGFAAVYVTLGRPDNAGKPDTVRTAAGTPAAPDPSTADKPSSADAGSGMAAFVKKASPEPMPEFAFVGPQGQALKLADFKGRVVLLNLWATWCTPCRKEMPSLDRLQKELGSGKFEVVALAVDRGGLDAARKFLGEVKSESLKLYADPTAKVGSALKAVGLPTTILIDKEGREVGRLAGPAEWDSAEAKRLIEAAIK